MLKLLNFLVTVVIIVLLVAMGYGLYSAMDYYNANKGTQTSDTTEQSFLGKAKDKIASTSSSIVDKATDLGKGAKDKASELGNDIKDGGTKAYDKVSDKVNKATAKLDAASDRYAKETPDGGMTEEDFDEVNAKETAAAKNEMKLKKDLADKKEILAAKGQTKAVPVEREIPSSYANVGSKKYKSSSNYSFYVIAGSYSEKSNAETEVKRFKTDGYKNAEVVKFARSKFHTVCIDRKSNMDDARALAKKLENLGVPAYVHTKRSGKK